MSKRALSFSEAISTYDRATDHDYIKLGEDERKQIIDLFPRSDWAAMPIERYALGQGVTENTFCGWLEFRSTQLGSIAGGAAKKLLVYKRKTGEGWYFDPDYGTVEQAWEQLRGAFVRAFELAEGGEWAAIDQLK